MSDIEEVLQDIPDFSTITDVFNFGSKVTLENTLPDITIRNMVYTVDVGCTLNLNLLYGRVRFTEYNPKRFPGCIMKLIEPRVSATLFTSGKVVMFGANSEKSGELAVRKIVRILQRVGYKIEKYAMAVHNIIGTCDLKVPISLDKLHESHTQFVRYEPELFPAIIYRLLNPRVVLLIFTNGKIIITGAKTMEQMQDAGNRILPVIKSFRKGF